MVDERIRGFSNGWMNTQLLLTVGVFYSLWCKEFWVIFQSLDSTEFGNRMWEKRYCGYSLEEWSQHSRERCKKKWMYTLSISLSFFLFFEKGDFVCVKKKWKRIIKKDMKIFQLFDHSIFLLTFMLSTIELRMSMIIPFYIFLSIFFHSWFSNYFLLILIIVFAVWGRSMKLSFFEWKIEEPFIFFEEIEEREKEKEKRWRKWGRGLWCWWMFFEI